ncbi:MAG: site-specific integrase [Flavobacteriaceae bacterium]|nr:site-specific integrase [Flavobacteriaceae bacterium]
MRVRFFVTKGKAEYVSIYMRFWDSIRIDQKAKTGMIVKYDYFSNAKQLVKAKADYKQKDFVNQNLRALRSHVIENYNVDFNSKKHIGKKWLKMQIDDYFGRANHDELYKIYLDAWVQRFIEEAPKRLHKGKPIARRTIQHYQTTLNKIVAFQDHNKTRLRFEDIGLKFYRDFLDYCRSVEKLNDNTIGGYIGNFKMWCRNIELEGLPVNQQYKHSEFMAISNKTSDVYLTESEINAIYEQDFSSSVRLDNARDLFVIGLRTGLRISDFLRLKEIDIKKGYIQIETAKTGEPVIIPLHHQIKAIIEKNGGKLPYSISDQRFNLYIKEVCQMAGITEKVEGAKMNPETKRKESGIYPKFELVSSHICRRSFATNLYGKLPNMNIMAITGHRTESQFLKYIKITKKEHAEMLRKHWAKEEKEQGYNNILTAIK